MTAPIGPATARWIELVGTEHPHAHHMPAQGHPAAPARPLRRDGMAARWAREVLPPAGGTVLDVGCGSGRAALALAPPATELIGVDPDAEALSAFVASAAAAGVARRPVTGPWPEVAPDTPIADVAVCHDVLYGVVDVAPFTLALTARARLAVVVEIPARHPDVAWSAAWHALAGSEPPELPDHGDLVAVLRELGLDPDVAVVPDAAHRPDLDGDRLVEVVRRRIGLPAERAGELAAWLAEHEPDWVEEVAVLRWPGAAEPD